MDRFVECRGAAELRRVQDEAEVLGRGSVVVGGEYGRIEGVVFWGEEDVAKLSAVAVDEHAQLWRDGANALLADLVETSLAHGGREAVLHDLCLHLLLQQLQLDRVHNPMLLAALLWVLDEWSSGNALSLFLAVAALGCSE